MNDIEKAAFEGNLVKIDNLTSNLKDSNKFSILTNALHAAIENEQFECVKYLVAKGVELETKVNNQTALEHAVDISIDGTIQNGGKPGDEPTTVIALLLETGANPQPGFEIAKQYQSTKIQEFIEQHTIKS
jgi:hypothetical protein